MNKKQKYIVIITIILIVVVIILWLAQGAGFFTKTQVLVDSTTELDRMLGIENKQYADKYIFGLLPSGTSAAEFLSVSTITAIVIVLSVVLLYLSRGRKGTQ
jgi:uncharacterized membrane protein